MIDSTVSTLNRRKSCASNGHLVCDPNDVLDYKMRTSQARPRGTSLGVLIFTGVQNRLKKDPKCIKYAQCFTIAIFKKIKKEYRTEIMYLV